MNVGVILNKNALHVLIVNGVVGHVSLKPPHVLSYQIVVVQTLRTNLNVL